MHEGHLLKPAQHIFFLSFCCCISFLGFISLPFLFSRFFPMLVAQVHITETAYVQSSVHTYTHTHTSFPPALLATQHSGLSTAPINKTEMSVSPWRPHRPCGQWSKVSPCLRPLCVFEEVKDAQKRSHSGYLAMKVHLKGPFSQKNLSSFTHLHAVLNLYDFISSLDHKRCCFGPSVVTVNYILKIY